MTDVEWATRPTSRWRATLARTLGLVHGLFNKRRAIVSRCAGQGFGIRVWYVRAWSPHIIYHSFHLRDAQRLTDVGASRPMNRCLYVEHSCNTTGRCSMLCRSHETYRTQRTCMSDLALVISTLSDLLGTWITDGKSTTTVITCQPAQTWRVVLVITYAQDTRR